MLIVIDLVDSDESVIVVDATKPVVDDTQKRKEAYLEWLRRAPQPQLVPVEKNSNA